MENSQETKAKLQQEADKLFDTHNHIDTLYITSDGQGFTEQQYADDHARYLKENKVYEFKRQGAVVQGKGADILNGDPEREALFAEYESLTGQKPQHNIGTEKLRAKVAEIKENSTNENTQ